MKINKGSRILQLDVSGQPNSWLTVEEAISYYAKDQVLYELGSPVVTYHGGINKKTNKESIITTNSIISIKGTRVKSKEFKHFIYLTNKTLFERDHYLCAYCGEVFSQEDLSREHIIPVCQKGENSWMNVVTSCKSCNNHKGGRTLEESNMKLLYLPYIPDRYESFILTQGSKCILADQMEFLLSKISKNSRFNIH